MRSRYLFANDGHELIEFGPSRSVCFKADADDSIYVGRSALYLVQKDLVQLQLANKPSHISLIFDRLQIATLIGIKFTQREQLPQRDSIGPSKQNMMQIYKLIFTT